MADILYVAFFFKSKDEDVPSVQKSSAALYN